MSDNDTLYRKRGRRYYPVAVDDPVFPHELGAWLTVVEPGQTVSRPVDPDYAGFYAAAHRAHGAMVDAMRETAMVRPRNKKLTKRQRECWAAFVESLGGDAPYLEYASLRTIADAGIEAVQKEMQNV